MIFTNFTYNGTTFNRFVRTSGYMAEVIAGDRIQIRSTTDPLPSQDGIQRYVDYYGSRLLEIRGYVKGSSESDLYTKVNNLQRAFDIGILEQSTSGDYGFLPLDWTDPGQTGSRYYVKPIDKTLVVTEGRTGLARQFSVLMEAKDPVRYSTVTTTTTITAGTSVAGGSTFPFAFPVAFGSSAFYGQATITNSGTVPVFPRLVTFYGPASGTWTGPKISNVTTGAYFQLQSGVTLVAGQRIEISPQDGTAYKYAVNGTYVDLSPNIVAGSTYWDLDPGANTVRVEGTSLPSGSYATIEVLSPYI